MRWRPPWGRDKKKQFRAQIERFFALVKCRPVSPCGAPLRAQCEMGLVAMRILTFDELKSEKGVVWTRDHLRRLCRAGQFPAPLALSSARIGWLEAEVDEWISKRAEHRGALPPRKRAIEALAQTTPARGRGQRARAARRMD